MATDPYNSNQRLRRRGNIGGSAGIAGDVVAPVTPFINAPLVDRGTDTGAPRSTQRRPAVAVAASAAPAMNDFDNLQRDNNDALNGVGGQFQRVDVDTSNAVRRAPGSFKRKDLPGVVQGRATINGVEQNVYSDSAFDPLMFGVANRAQRAEALKRRPELAATFNEYDKFAGAQHTQENQRADAAAAARAAQAAELQMAAITKERAQTPEQRALDVARANQANAVATRERADASAAGLATEDGVAAVAADIMKRVPKDADEATDWARQFGFDDPRDAAQFQALNEAIQGLGDVDRDPRAAAQLAQLLASPTARRMTNLIAGKITSGVNNATSMNPFDDRKAPWNDSGIMPQPIDLKDLKFSGDGMVGWGDPNDPEGLGSRFGVLEGPLVELARTYNTQFGGR